MTLGTWYSINNRRSISRSLRLTRRQRDSETRRVSTSTNDDAFAHLKVSSSLRRIPGGSRQDLTKENAVFRCFFPPSLFLSLLETHLLTAARLIPPLSTGKRVPSLLLFLLPRAFIHFGGCLPSPVRDRRKKKTSHCRRLINPETRVRGGGCKLQLRDAQGVAGGLSPLRKLKEQRV